MAQTLKKVLEILEQYEFELNYDKCQFLKRVSWSILCLRSQEME